MSDLAKENEIFPLSAESVPTSKTTILAVDDDRIAMTILLHALKDFGYNVVTATSGTQALDILNGKATRIDAVILDREMPGLSGMDVIERMKAVPALAAIPVIMLTGSGATDQIQAGIDAGVFYYMIKPANGPLLQSLISAALRERRHTDMLATELSRHDAAAKSIGSCQMTVRTLLQAQDSARFLATCFPNPERVIGGLMELLINAVEHGNLGITYEDKTKLLAANIWRREISRRLALPENQNKAVEIVYQHKPEGWFVQITDQGPGFDWRRYWHIDPARATASHGRGIARARLGAFDRLTYNEAGNQVIGVVQAEGGTLDW